MTWNPGPPYDPRSSPPHSRPMGSPAEHPARPPHAHPSRHGPPGSSPQHHAHRHPHHGPPPPYRFAQPPRHSPPPPPPPHYDHGRHDYYPRRGSSYPPPAYSTRRPHYGPPPSARQYDSTELRTSPPRDLSASPPTTCSPIDAFRTGGCTCKKSRCLKLYCQCFAMSSTCGPKCKCQACQNTTLHVDAIEEARKTILERNPSAFDDKFKTPANSGVLVSAPPLPPPIPYRYSPPTTAAPAPTLYYPPPPQQTYQKLPPQPAPPSPPTLASTSSASLPPPRVNKFGCKCRRSFCLKKYCECYQNSVHCGLNCRCTNCKNYPKDPQDPEVPPLGATVPALRSPLFLTEESRAVSMESTSCKPTEEVEEQDRMAIMAAVAMTELLGNAPPRRVSIGETESAEEAKRKAEEMSPEHSVPLKKRKTLFIPEPMSTSPERTMMESRNPSPVSTLTPPTYHHMPPPQLHYRQQRQQLLLQHRHHAHHHPHQRPHRAHYSYYPAPPPPRASPTYEDVIKSSGLPKSLSFRKICSKCGKTRGEHGELGFGNKCVYQECGKCGASVQMHLKAGSPMGILCCLTEPEGAIPGAKATYDRKIRDLAARAELQKTLAEDKRERAERLAKAYP